MTQDLQKEGRDTLVSMSSSDFLNFGLHDVAYVKTVRAANRELYGLFSANGQLIGHFDDPADFMGAVADENMDIVAVH